MVSLRLAELASKICRNAPASLQGLIQAGVNIKPVSNAMVLLWRTKKIALSSTLAGRLEPSRAFAVPNVIHKLQIHLKGWLIGKTLISVTFWKSHWIRRLKSSHAIVMLQSSQLGMIVAQSFKYASVKLGLRKQALLINCFTIVLTSRPRQLQ